MKIVFIHYHLKPGGVTTVIKQQAESIESDAEILILTGELAETVGSFKTDVVEGLGYDQEGSQREPPSYIAKQISNAIREQWPDGCDLIHVHNPTLAKNRDFLKILTELQNTGHRLLLQIHDFAEDGRPQVYYSEEYPVDCHYAVINSRDFQTLLNAGLNQSGLHLIPNSVTPSNPAIRADAIENTILYPIRALRRKNIGEAILLSLFFINEETLAFTLPPNSEVDIAPYEGWKRFVADNNLSVLFDIGLKRDFDQLLSASSWVITTSIMEGFGFSYLEPWTAEKLLWGRKLPQICADFEKHGISLDHLYEKLVVPVDWIGEDRIFSKWENTIFRNCNFFNYAITRKEVTSAIEDITSGGVIDFGLLDEALQKEIISLLLLYPDKGDELKQLNPFLRHPGPPREGADDLIRKNARLIRQHFSSGGYGSRLKQIYRRVVETPVAQKIDKKALFSDFLNLAQFSLLKWGSYSK